jgi:hypothetical protein
LKDWPLVVRARLGDAAVREALVRALAAPSKRMEPVSLFAATFVPAERRDAANALPAGSV